MAEETQGRLRLWTVSPDGQTFRDVFRTADDRHYRGWGHGLAWSQDGAKFAIRTDAREWISTSQFVLATATREGDDWRILAVADGESEQGFRLCNIPGQGPIYPSHQDIKKHCEPTGERNP